ncbi:hypothetical protein [Tessaracoccus antarcticus]|uniref:Uncharacterized protein n=1 Tax=Tessaracoccus antarcticus TaxID=2479848 RepID=A0A3M0GIH5_9ACTN|nr:hypothetical protein [Tessaracoccus antarcticus]RMB57066.1 hypothetical protein EAX62_16370 [Tessaracoccus antarcticus]
MGGFKLDKRALDKLAQSAVKDVVQDAQKQLDKVYHQHKGASVSVIEPALRRAMSSTSMQLDKAQLREWAQMIGDGNQIEFRTR